MALYPDAVKRLIPPGSNDPKITARVAILHVDANNATGEDLFRYFSSGSGGIESHFHVEKDGTVYQFRDTAYQADANMQANNFAISIETQGVAAGEWTIAQLASIKALLSWCHITHGIPLVKCPAWDGSGVGYHILFMQEWAGGPRSCPGPDRIKQFDNTLVPWMATGQEVDPMTDYAAQLDTIQSYANAAKNDAYAAHVHAKAAHAAVDALTASLTPDKVAAAVLAKLPPAATGGVTTADVEAAVKSVMLDVAQANAAILGKA